MNRPFMIRLRPTLLATIVGLVLLTALTIGGGAAILTLSVTRTLINQARTDAVTAAREETRQLFDEPPRIARQLAAAAHRGALPLDDRQKLAIILAEVLRNWPRLAVIGYGHNDGNWYVGAERQADGAIVEYTADPAVNGGVPMAATIAADGTLAAPQSSNMGPYSVVDRPWFKEGIAKPGPMWSQFYRFTTGVVGITSMSRVMMPEGNTPVGVFHVDLQISGIAEFLSTLRVGQRGAVFLVDRNGDRLVTPTGPGVDRAIQALDEAASQRKTATLAAPAQILLGSRLYEVVFEPVPTEGAMGLAIGVVIDLRDITDGAYLHAALAAVVGLAVLLLAVLSARSLSSRIARPVGAIARDLAQVGQFNISREPAPQSFIREVSELGASVDGMKASLRSFARYVPTDLVRRLLADGIEAELGGEIRRLTIHFSDVADFTAMSEGVEPDRLVEAMGRYFGLMTGALTRHGGTVDKFMGDGIMAFFNAPEELPGHAEKACLAALEAQRLLAQMATESAPSEPVFHARIGLGTGEVLVGNIGTPERFAYTLLGDEVNLASRLEGLNKLYGTKIIASAAVRDEAGGRFEWRTLDKVAVKGRTQGTLVCELLGLAGEISGETLAARDVYERALGAYFAAQFERAAVLFDEAARLRPGDLAAAMMRERARELSDDPPLTWSGIHVMEEK
jgi:adenylate cyclase